MNKTEPTLLIYNTTDQFRQLSEMLSVKKKASMQFGKYLYITFFLFFVGLTNLCAQTETYSLDIKQITVRKAMEEIEAITPYTFLYNTATLNLDRNVNISVKKGSIHDIVRQLISGSDLEYSIVNGQVILKKKGASVPSRSKEESLKGIIKDENGVPMLGATIWNQTMEYGTWALEDGSFELSQVAIGDVLMISSVGYADIIHVVENFEPLYLVMEETAFLLEGVDVVSSGYEQISKERATGSYDNMKEVTLDSKISNNILSELNGEINGVLFDGDINEDSDIVIRGINSISTANRSPLIVVDGFPVEGGISSINPNDVKRVTVLKDAAAASIWGIRAANGVIVIESKKGNRNKKMMIEASVNTSFSPIPKLKNVLASKAQQLEYLKSIYQLAPSSYNIYQEGESISSSNFYKQNPVIEILKKQDLGLITQTEANAAIERLSNLNAESQLNRYVYQPIYSNQYNLAFSGGGESNDYRVSLAYNSSKGRIRGTGSDAYTINIANNLDISKKLRLKTAINTYITDTRLEPDDSNYDLSSTDPRETQFFIGNTNLLTEVSMFDPIVDENGNLTAMAVGGGADAYASEAAQNLGHRYSSTYNIKQELDNNDNRSKSFESRIRLALEYDLFESLTLSGLYQYEWGKTKMRNYFNENRYIARMYNNIFTEIAGDGTVTHHLPEGGIADFTESDLSAHTFRTQLNFNKSFADGKHQVNALAGYEARKIINESNGYRRYGFNDQTLASSFPEAGYLNSVTTSPINDESQVVIPSYDVLRFDENRFLSYYANASYTLNNIYTLSSSIRLDDTNLFGVSSEVRNRPLFSVGLKWNVARDFFADSEDITDLNLRATYGTNGNVDQSTSPYLQSGVGYADSRYNNQSGFVISLPNPQLRLEKTRSFNFGLDVGLWNGVVNASVDVYDNLSTDLLSPQQLNATVGVGEQQLNIGSLSNQGIDVTLDVGVVNSPNFNYNTTANFSYNKNEITKLDVETNTVNNLLFGTTVLNEPLNTYYSAQYAGLDRDGKPQYLDASGNIIDYTTDITDTAALRKEGTTTAPIFGSWINNLNYKGWGLRTLVVFQGGHIFQRNYIYDPSSSDTQNVMRDFENRWQTRGDENNTDIPALAIPSEQSSPGYQLYAFSSNQYDNATNIRLQEIILSYSLGENILKNLKLDNLKFSFQINNLKSWNFNKWDIDPYEQYELLSINTNYTFGITTTF
ncbi:MULTISPECIES: SusC/RagA family TonB-linked outer membrane protein [Flavobacteriaceae]|uniref:SusC/RagA family TonB-linked outer membrane protein n=1 Tax=Flavobacteriaceae TaxID=49546 RepID=UPI001492A1F2|nr:MULTISPECIES: SusC/RagA family TonB-linked outer membrane protein [Allomuricauda]MDC6367534.1 SusC/RagA family TonB-linked outer membrane protein [Muricauda sp. AC10]